ncbi:MAG: PAS domain S-box protein [Ignavibacteria bacterium]
MHNGIQHSAAAYITFTAFHMDKLYGSKKKPDHSNQAFRISMYYFVIGFLWITVSNIIVKIQYNNNPAEFFLETGKGIIFVVITSLLLYFLLKKYFTSLDITNREVSLSEEKYRTLTENIDFAVIRHDKECRYEYLNSAARNILKDLIKQDGKTDITGLTPEEVYKDPEIAAMVRKNNNYVIGSGEHFKGRLASGNKYLSYNMMPEFDPAGSIISVITLISDETETTRSIIKLEESEKFNSHLVNSSNVVVYIFDIKSQKHIYNNKALMNALGYSPEEVMALGGNLIAETMHPEDMHLFRRYVTDKIFSLKDEEVAEFEYRMLHKQGYYCWFKSHDCVLKRDENGIPVQILGSSIDITDLKTTQDELTKKSDYLKAIIEASPISIFDLDKNGKIISIWNKASEEIFGWKAAEVIGKTLPIIPNERINELRENIELNLSKKYINGKEYLRKRKDGSEIAIRIYSRPVKNKAGEVQAILSYNEDITLQNKYQDGLKKSQEYLRLLYEASLAANNTLDPGELYKKCFGFIEKILSVTGIVVSIVTDDGKYIKYDALRVNGVDVDASKIPLMQLKPDGKGPQTMTIKSGKALIISDLEECMKHSENDYFVDTDGDVCTKDETVENVSRATIMIPLKHENKVIGVLHVQSYKTDFYTEEDLHKLEPFAFIFSSAIQRARLYGKLQDELAEKEIAFQQIRKFAKGIENSPNSIVITNNKYEIEYVNPYFSELTGYSFEEVAGKNPSILKSGQTNPEVYEDLWKTLDKGETWHGEFLNLKKTGELYWEAASIGPIADSYGNITHFIAIKQDITEKKKQDKEIKDSLEEKEIMLKEIHHRVKNNLQVISSLLNMQIEQYKSPEAIAAINSSRNRVKAMTLVHENLYKSRNITKTPLKEYIYMLVKNIYSSYGVSTERVKFNCEIHSIEFGLDTIIPLGLILNEAVSNSLKHAFPVNISGWIEIYINEFPEAEGKRNYELHIKDNGVGLPAEFSPEKTSSLGTTLITSLAEQLDGEAIFNNHAGTEVIVKFKEIKYKERK